eukprot:3902626-Heterocapsa_arctica.AAC.1
MSRSPILCVVAFFELGESGFRPGQAASLLWAWPGVVLQVMLNGIEFVLSPAGPLSQPPCCIGRVPAVVHGMAFVFKLVGLAQSLLLWALPSGQVPYWSFCATAAPQHVLTVRCSMRAAANHLVGLRACQWLRASRAL